MSRSLRPSRQALLWGMLLLLVALVCQSYLAWLAINDHGTRQSISGIAGAFASVSFGSWLLLVVIFLLVADLVLSWNYPLVTLQRTLAHSLALDRWVTIELQVSSATTRPVTLELMDYVPADCDYQQLPVAMTLVHRELQVCRYRCCPRRRGPLLLEHCAVRAKSLLGFWQLTVIQPVNSTARVFPDFTSVEGYQLLATDHQTSQLGIQRKPRRGEGLDFHQLREYRVGDALRQIDWNATARRQRLISREYQDERDQQVVLMLDCGRRMLTQDGIATHFDHCLNGLLMLTYIALRQGDAVGMMSFGNTVRHAAPLKGAANMPRMINHFYDLYPDKSVPDYRQAAQALMSRYRKRSLIVFATNLRDEDTDDLLTACHLLQRHHLVMVANLREAALDRVITRPVENFSQALRFAGTLDYLQQREKVQRLLRAQGLNLIDSLPQQLTMQLINHYFAIKRAGIW